ncbi:hypothetical protein E2C01_058431 [Portunus trituberculatus]|uniref:Uncharacterized protein n=1 Tax=Portunus trituberculatus TaxID=210409 RepID=A0A5B7H2Z5_PORTR|nr:hypothetical protein [Portunus trituberculatus]
MIHESRNAREECAWVSTSDISTRMKINEQQQLINNPGGEATKDVTPSFNYVRPVPPRYVIVVEDTAIMNVQVSSSLPLHLIPFCD